MRVKKLFLFIIFASSILGNVVFSAEKPVELELCTKLYGGKLLLPLKGALPDTSPGFSPLVELLLECKILNKGKNDIQIFWIPEMIHGGNIQIRKQGDDACLPSRDIPYRPRKINPSTIAAGKSLSFIVNLSEKMNPNVVIAESPSGSFIIQPGKYTLQLIIEMNVKDTDADNKPHPLSLKSTRLEFAMLSVTKTQEKELCDIRENNDNEATRSLAAILSIYCHEKGPSRLALVDVFSSKHPEVNYVGIAGAVSFFREVKDHDFIKRIESFIISSPNDVLRTYAAFALGELKSEGSIPLLFKSIEENKPEELAAIQALGKINTPICREKLEQILSDKKYSERQKQVARSIKKRLDKNIDQNFDAKKMSKDKAGE